MTKVANPEHDRRTIEGRPALVSKLLFTLGEFDLRSPDDRARLSDLLDALGLSYGAANECAVVKVYLEHVHDTEGR